MLETKVPRVGEKYADLNNKLPSGEYNFKHFRTKHLVRDGKRTVANRGILPGEIAPDFELATSGGDTVRLSDFRGKPVLLKFGSFS